MTLNREISGPSIYVASDRRICHGNCERRMSRNKMSPGLPGELFQLEDNTNAAIIVYVVRRVPVAMC